MKKLLLIGSVIVIIIVVLLGVLVSNLGPIIKTAVNTYGPQITGTKVSVGDVGISILSGDAKLKDFFLGNPRGFRSPYAVKVGSVYVDIDERSLTTDTIIINKIEVKAPEITYEKKAGTDNFQSLLNHVKSSEGPAEPSGTQPKKDGKGKKIIITDFILENGKVTLATTLAGGRSVSAPLPSLHLKDLGKDTGGTSPAKIFEKIFAAIHKNITSGAVMDTLNKNLKAIQKDLGTAAGSLKQRGESASKDLQNTVDSLKGSAKKLLGK